MKRFTKELTLYGCRVFDTNEQQLTTDDVVRILNEQSEEINKLKEQLEQAEARVDDAIDNAKFTAADLIENSKRAKQAVFGSDTAEVPKLSGKGLVRKNGGGVSVTYTFNL
jgi:vacuolar-type H+-ATPase subunit I/STV1